MTRSERHLEQPKSFLKKSYLILTFLCIASVLAIHFYSKSLIKIEAPKKELGEKVVIRLPSGNTVYTYDNLLIKKDGKLYYKGERNTIDLTGGIILYEEWDE